MLAGLSGGAADVMEPQDFSGYGLSCSMARKDMVPFEET